MSVCEYFESTDSKRRDINVGNVQQMENDGDGLFEAPDWMLDNLSFSIGDNVRLNVQLAFGDVNAAYAAGGTGGFHWTFLGCFRSNVKIWRQLSTYSQRCCRAFALSENGEALLRVGPVEAEGDEALHLVEAVKAF